MKYFRKKCVMCGKEFCTNWDGFNTCTECPEVKFWGKPVAPTPPGIINAPRFDPEYFKVGDAFEVDNMSEKYNIIITERYDETIRYVSNLYDSGSVTLNYYLSGSATLRKLS